MMNMTSFSSEILRLNVTSEQINDGLRTFGEALKETVK